jgi:hypothetical protein
LNVIIAVFTIVIFADKKLLKTLFLQKLRVRENFSNTQLFCVFGQKNSGVIFRENIDFAILEK